MNKKNNETFWQKYQVWVWAGVFAIIVVFLWSANWYFLLDYTDKGTFGDMFGAVNALFSGLAFVGVIVAIFLQKDELEEQRKQLALQTKELELTRKEFEQTRKEFEQQNETMSQQRFENTFFNMLKLHNDIIETMEATRYKFKYRGKASFRAFKLLLTDIYDGPIDNKKADDLSHAKLAFTAFSNEYGYNTEHYFRNLYNIIKFVEKADLPFEEKKIYTNLLRAQLSRDELLLLCVNCVSCDSYKPFKELVEKYSLLKHVTPNHKIFFHARDQYHKKAFDKDAV